MTTNLVRVVDGAVGGIGLVGVVAAALWLQSGSGRLPELNVLAGFMLVVNIFSATLNLTQAISYRTRVDMVAFAVMTGLLALVSSSLGIAVALTGMFFAGGFLEGSCREGIYRRQCLKQHRVNRVARPGRSGVTPEGETPPTNLNELRAMLAGIDVKALTSVAEEKSATEAEPVGKRKAK